jgi:hypothetical protein
MTDSAARTLSEVTNKVNSKKVKDKILKNRKYLSLFKIEMDKLDKSNLLVLEKIFPLITFLVALECD